MAEREPTVIERMLAAFWDAIGWPDFFADPGNAILDHKKKEHRVAMLAAVRELVVVAREADTPNGDTVADWIAGWVRECENSQVSNSDERRAGGKGE